jgi:hypothetical protein
MRLRRLTGKAGTRNRSAVPGGRNAAAAGDVDRQPFPPAAGVRRGRRWGSTAPAGAADRGGSSSSSPTNDPLLAAGRSRTVWWIMTMAGGAAGAHDRAALPGAPAAGRAEQREARRPGVPLWSLRCFSRRSRPVVPHRPGRGEGAGTGRGCHRRVRSMSGPRGMPGVLAAPRIRLRCLRGVGRPGRGGTPVAPP